MSSFKNPVLIYNPAAGGKRAKKRLNKNFYKLEKVFPSIDIFESNSKDDTIEKVKSVHKEKKNDLIITFGGDGTIASACNGLMGIAKKDRLPLLPLPFGSGNSFLRDFEVFSVDDALKKHLDGNIKEVDLIKVDEIESDYSWYCPNVLGMGFVSDIADYVVNEGKKYGGFSYLLGTFFALKKFKPYKTVIKYDGGKKTFESDKVYFFTASNTMYSGGKIMVAPDAKYDDGLMDVVILYDISRIQFLKGFLKTFKGNHVKEKGCFNITTKDLEIYAEPKFYLMPDGELEGYSPVKLKVVPKEIKLAL